jgi:hypothetical protein
LASRRVCAGLVQQGLVEVIEAGAPDTPLTVTELARDFEPQGLRFVVQGVPWALPREGLPDAAQARRHRVLAKALGLAQHLHLAARAAAPAPAQGAVQACRRWAGSTGHHRPLAAQ